jgi:hypothetical protein
MVEYTAKHSWSSSRGGAAEAEDRVESFLIARDILGRSGPMSFHASQD